MNYHYEASQTFYYKLKEVDDLLKLIKNSPIHLSLATLIKNNESEESKPEYLRLAKKIKQVNESSIYSSLIKSSIVLMTAYFEVFIEDIIEEFITKLNNANLESEFIPAKIRKFQAKYIQEKFEKLYPNSSRNNEFGLMYLIDNWNNKNVKLDVLNAEIEYRNYESDRIEKIKVKPINKFNYGSHGSNELEELFKNIGLDIFNNSNKKDKELFNALVDKRNNIVHSNRDTLEVSYRDTKVYLISLKKSIKKIDNIIKQYLPSNS